MKVEQLIYSSILTDTRLNPSYPNPCHQALFCDKLLVLVST